MWAPTLPTLNEVARPCDGCGVHVPLSTGGDVDLDGGAIFRSVGLHGCLTMNGVDRQSSRRSFARVGVVACTPVRVVVPCSGHEHMSGKQLPVGPELTLWCCSADVMLKLEMYVI